MSNLTPEVRVNKNGVPVTKHVKRDDALSGAKNPIPSPVLHPSEKKKPLKLLPRQQESKFQGLDRTTFRPSEELLKALPFQYRGERYNYDMSDEAAYSMFSTMRVNDALHMIHFGIKTKDEALGFLMNRKLDSLVQDNSAMMQEALERRIPALNFVALHGDYGMNGHPPGIFLDAAEAYSSGTLRSLESPTSLNTVHLRVLAGDLSLADIKKVGISRIQKSNASQTVLNSLQFMKNGSLDCTADDIRDLIDKNNKDNSVSAPLKWALQSINIYGAEFLVGVDRLLSASAMAEYYEHKAVPVPEIKELITYEGIMRRNGRAGSYPHMKALRDAGVDPAVAGKLYNGQESVTRIIGAQKDEVPVAVSGGWL
jgi:hypothetical protein